MTEKTRCKWCLSTDKMIHYHDTYWGAPLHNDQELFAELVLDLNQAGLSWATILNKQENFYEAFDNFEIEKMAYMTRIRNKNFYKMRELSEIN